MRRRQRRRFRPPSSASLTSGYGREETRPCISESEGRPPDSRQAAVFRSRNNIRVQKTNDPAGRRGREVHGAGDGTRTREYKLGNLFPVPLRATPPCAIETIVPGETGIRTKRTKRAHPQTGRRNADFSRLRPAPIPSFGYLRNPYSFLK